MGLSLSDCIIVVSRADVIAALLKSVWIMTFIFPRVTHFRQTQITTILHVNSNLYSLRLTLERIFAVTSALMNASSLFWSPRLPFTPGHHE